MRLRPILLVCLTSSAFEVGRARRVRNAAPHARAPVPGRRLSSSTSLLCGTAAFQKACARAVGRKLGVDVERLRECGRFSTSAQCEGGVRCVPAAGWTDRRGRRAAGGDLTRQRVTSCTTNAIDDVHRGSLGVRDAFVRRRNGVRGGSRDVDNERSKEWVQWVIAAATSMTHGVQKKACTVEDAQVDASPPPGRLHLARSAHKVRRHGIDGAGRRRAVAGVRRPGDGRGPVGASASVQKVGEGSAGGCSARGAERASGRMGAGWRDRSAEETRPGRVCRARVLDMTRQTRPPSRKGRARGRRAAQTASGENEEGGRVNQSPTDAVEGVDARGITRWTREQRASPVCFGVM